MSLLGLLSLGRSFGAVRRRPPSYQRADGWLPDFGRRREREFGNVGGEDTVLSASSWPERDLGGACTPALFEVRSAAPSGRTKDPQQGAGAGKDVGSSQSPRLRRGSPGVRSKVVQGELSLETVRVIRNDLNADDLELVPRSLTLPTAGLVVPPRSRRARGGGWRGWLAHWVCFFRRRGAC